ncbi:MAG TPA: hypothetical protein VMU54_14740 [Planctomycetota bacterium]|nr:hypothetical protein [Planctomycetota bacterium]
MLQVVTLFLCLAATQDPLVIKGELKELPAQGKDGPSFHCEGTSNLPNGADLSAYLYYGAIVVGKELFKDSAIIRGGKFSQEFPIFAHRNFPGTYTARLIYDPALQGLGVPDYPRTTVDLVLQIGGAADIDRESKAVREQLIGEIRGLLAIADQIRGKLEEMKDKAQADREALFKTWHEQMLEVRKRVDPRQHPEYYILRLDLMADSGVENLSGILTSSARCFVLNQHENTVEGLTRLRQSCEYWIGEISTPRLLDFSKMAASVEECRSIVRKVLDSPDDPVQPSRRRFLELTAVLDKSVPDDFHEVILGITARAASFFNAVSDKSPDAKKLHADLDGLLQRFASTLSDHK